ncbi:MetQ/NlpA family ABC transporter substrate-binding protein, partial [[Kitasatospora] papulosa]|uniref:MetQ/NlpA family ABC transporter substrate-binding protein n=1 Tax=[Kitasatospora] papulosa TaxID=1464011 RepID=UPI00367D2A71
PHTPGGGPTAIVPQKPDRTGREYTALVAATVPRALNDVDAAVINGNYAIEADLKPSEDALVLEKAEGNPYANFLAVKKGNEKDARVAKLAKLLNSPEVKQYIEDTYTGSVVPAFGAPAK